jgi:2-oxoglutarate dehydrogenase E2 component (dihydrolipoamide succinyltransferase)
MADKTDLVVPELGESITEAVVGRWLKQVGEAVAAEEPVVDLETDKVTVQLPAPGAGVLTEQRVAEGATVKVGDVVGTVELRAGVAAVVTPPKPPSVPTPLPPPPSATAKPMAAAAAIGAAAEAHVAERDDNRRLSPSERRAALAGGGNGETALAPAPAGNGQREEIVNMSPLRKRIAERLVEAQHSAAMLTTFNEIDMTAVMALREQVGKEFLDRHGIKLGFMSFFVKAAVRALQLYPGLNAEVRGDAIAYKKHYDIGVAVGGGKGLVVPVIRGADQLGFAGIEKTIADLAARALDGRITLPELTGGTFTVSNGGIYGSMMSTPILNHPQTGILGMHKIMKRPVAIDDQLVIRPMMYVALSYDHRVVDGREAVQFLIAVKERVERPDRLMLDI